jgi:hypothetical protein
MDSGHLPERDDGTLRGLGEVPGHRLADLPSGGKETISEEVDVHGHKLAEQIMKALKHAGIQHVEFWPEHMLRERLDVRPVAFGTFGRFIHEYPRRKNLGPFHIRVREEWFHDAHTALIKSGLTES